MDVSNNESTLQQNTFLQGAKDCVPTLFGYMSIGLAFGIVGVASNLSILEIACLAIFIYAGSRTIYYLRTFSSKRAAVGNHSNYFYCKFTTFFIKFDIGTLFYEVFTS